MALNHSNIIHIYTFDEFDGQLYLVMEREIDNGGYGWDLGGRVELIQEDVFTVKTDPVDAVLAMNFSYWLFQDRAKMLAYFRSLRKALADDGLLFLDRAAGAHAIHPRKTYL